MNYSIQRLLAAFAIALMVALPGAAYATGSDDAVQPSEEADYSVAGMHFHAANVVTMDEATDKDLYVAGSTVTIKNEISGDVFAAGQDVTVDGTVHGDVRVAGSVVTITGVVDGNVVAAGSTVKIAKDAKIKGYVNAYGATVVIDGTVEKAVHASAEEVALNGVFNGDVAVEATNATLGKEAVVATAMTVNGPNAPTINNDAMKEKVTFTERQLQTQSERSMQEVVVGAAMGVLYSFIATALIAAVVLYFMSAPMMRSVAQIEVRSGNVLAIGFAVLICVPVLAFILLFTFIGIPLSIFTFIVYGVALILSSIPVSIWIGQKLLPSQSDEHFQGLFTQYLAGSAIISLIGITPFIGWIVTLLVTATGLGSLYLVFANKTDYRKKA